MANLPTLMALSPLDGRYHHAFDKLRELTSEYGLIRERLHVEILWLIALSRCRQVPDVPTLDEAQEQYLTDIYDRFTLAQAEEIQAIEGDIKHDIKAIEYFLGNKLLDHPTLKLLIPFIHFGSTSDDVSNVAYSVVMQAVREQVLLPALEALIVQLRIFSSDYADLAMLARTHGQPASPTTLGKEFANSLARVVHEVQTLKSVNLTAKFNGSVGNYNALHLAYPDVDWLQFTRHFIEDLGLKFNACTTQIEPHDRLSEYLQCLSRINTILLDCARDCWGYISIDYFQLQSKQNEVGSSVMPHKVNPIDFENAEGNLGVANALCGHFAEKLPVSRWQRDLSDSTVLRNLGCIMGYSVLAFQNLLVGLKKIQPNLVVIERDLTNHWEVLSEGIQTVMRRYGISEAYEQLKAVTRGEKIDDAGLRAFISQLSLPDSIKEQLLALRPDNYLGYASLLALKISNNEE